MKEKLIMYLRSYEIVRKYYIYFDDITMWRLNCTMLNVPGTSLPTRMNQHSGVSSWKPIRFNRVDVLEE